MYVPSDHQVGRLEILRGHEKVDPGAWNKALPIDGLARSNPAGSLVEPVLGGHQDGLVMTRL